MCLCYLFSEKTAWQLVNRKADFLQNESIWIDSHNESNRIDSNRELECSTVCSLCASPVRGRMRQELHVTSSLVHST